jgi:hypothetical protein
MNVIKKKVIKTVPRSVYSFVEPISYIKTYFGMNNDTGDERVPSYVLETTVGSLRSAFKIFEDMPQVHEWPLSKLIQRELDHERASLICRDYLLAEGYLKYFPPLTAVLIPTGSDYLPTDKYGEKSEEDGKVFNQQIMGTHPEYSEMKCQQTVKGIFEISDSPDESGLLCWDTNQLSAVIIDGQHRYKALMKAVEEQKDYDMCQVVVNLIDLVPICIRKKKGPTSMARDLFVTINNTPVEVDEARLVLMDDRDALATFTQVLVDDSQKDRPPAIPPELIDWKCDGGKHDLEISLSGVLTIRGIIAAAMFENKTLASVDNRTNRSLVKKWLTSLESWLGVDPIIEAKLNRNETLKYRFEVACESGDENLDDEEEHQPFLFSYSAAAVEIVKERFDELYKPVFTEVFSKLLPFKSTIDLANASGAFNKKTHLHTYLRTFQSQRTRSEKENPEIRKDVSKFKDQMKRNAKNSIPHTVMGQKAIFKALFQLYLSDMEVFTSDDILSRTMEFINRFNELHPLLQASNNFDENFFSTEFALKKSIDTKIAGDLGRFFWKGIILGGNNEIEYGPAAVDLLKSLLIDLLVFDSNSKCLEFTEKEKIIKKHASLIRKINSEILDEKAREIATNIVVGKQNYLFKLMGL